MTAAKRSSTKARGVRAPRPRRAKKAPTRAKRPSAALSPKLLATWSQLLINVSEDQPRLRQLVRALDEPWRDVLSGEASYGPGNSADLSYWACSNPEGTVWLLQLQETVDHLEGFRNADDEADAAEDEDPDITVSEEVVAALQVPPGTDEHAAVRRLVRLWEKLGDGRVIELVTSDGVFDLTPPPEEVAPRPREPVAVRQSCESGSKGQAKGARGC